MGDDTTDDRLTVEIPNISEREFSHLLASFGVFQTQALQHGALTVFAESYMTMLRVAADHPDAVGRVVDKETLETVGSLDDDEFVEWVREMDPDDPDLTIEEIVNDIGRAMVNDGHSIEKLDDDMTNIGFE